MLILIDLQSQMAFATRSMDAGLLRNTRAWSPRPRRASAILATLRRGPAAPTLAAFTLAATFLSPRFWEQPAGMERTMAANAFFEHLGLAGGFLLVAWHAAKDPAR